MSMVIVADKLTREAVQKAREDYGFYLKITADINQENVAIGGEYHADAERMLTDKCGSKSKDIWGGGYNLNTQTFETNAIINLRQPGNPSMEILDPKIRKEFLKIVTVKLKDIEKYL